MEQMEDTLEQIRALRPYIAEALVERVIAHAQKRKVDSEFLTPTVLFCNFTGPDILLDIWGKTGTRRVTTLLSAYFSTVYEVITRYGGIIARIDPYSKGTKLLALFGAPVSHQDDPLRAVRAALMMNVELEVLNERWKAKFARHLPKDFEGPLLLHRIGITVGETFAGQVGSTNRREYTVMGDDVNLSARLMGSAKMGQILISEAVYEVVSSFFYFTELSPIRVKGKSNLIPLFQVDGPKTDTLLSRVQQRGRLIGRENEVERGEALVTQALGGESASLAIQGPAGIGKSHLVDVLLQKAIQQGVEAHSYQCSAYNADISYACWSGILRSLAGITSTDPDLLRKEKLQRLFKALSIKDQHATQLARLIGIDFSATPDTPQEAAPPKEPKDSKDILGDLASGRRSRRRGRSLDILSQLDKQVSFDTSQRGFQIPSQLSQSEQELLLQAVVSLMSKLLSKSPQALFFEDAQWMDPASLEMINAVQEQLKTESLLILMCKRGIEDQPSPWSTINLNPLNEQGTSQLVADVLVSDLVQIIHDHSKGSPLFIQEITQWIQQTWKISTTDIVKALQTSDILQNLVLSSLENLPENQREVARVGSVIGEEFRVGELQWLLPSTIDSVTLYNDLRELADARFITLIEAGVDPRYAYQQKLVRDVLYNSLPFARRRELHTKLAEYLISPPTQRSEIHSKVSAFLNVAALGNPVQDAKVIASHYEAAENWAEASKHWLRAAEQLWEQNASKEAAEIFDRALINVEKVPASKQSSDILALKLTALTGIGNTTLVNGDHSKALSAYEAALALPLEGDSSDIQSSLQKKICLLLPLNGQAKEAEKTLRELCDTQDSEPDLMTAASLAWLLWRDQSPEAGEWINRCRDMLPTEADRWSDGVEALLLDLSGDWEQAIENYKSIDQPMGTGLAMIRAGDELLGEGNITEALEHFEGASEIFIALPDGGCGLTLVYYRLAEAFWAKQDIDTSRSNLDQAQSASVACPAVVRKEVRDLIVGALEIINGESEGPWGEWRWDYFDDVFRIGLLFRA
jgi:class 3 adenylate cyclase/tetratricopeptide (TPR) repeat protein